MRWPWRDTNHLWVSQNAEVAPVATAMPSTPSSSGSRRRPGRPSRPARRRTGPRRAGSRRCPAATGTSASCDRRARDQRRRPGGRASPRRRPARPPCRSARAVATNPHDDPISARTPTPGVLVVGDRLEFAVLGGDAFLRGGSRPGRRRSSRPAARAPSTAAPCVVVHLVPGAGMRHARPPFCSQWPSTLARHLGPAAGARSSRQVAPDGAGWQDASMPRIDIESLEDEWEEDHHLLAQRRRVRPAVPGRQGPHRGLRPGTHRRGRQGARRRPRTKVRCSPPASRARCGAPRWSSATGSGCVRHATRPTRRGSSNSSNATRCCCVRPTTRSTTSGSWSPTPTRSRWSWRRTTSTSGCGSSTGSWCRHRSAGSTPRW